MHEIINEIEKDLSENAELLEFMKLCRELPADQLQEVAAIVDTCSKCEAINMKLDIMACKMGELSEELVKKILKCWDDGSAIETVTLFSLGSTVILNIDSPHYAIHLKLTEAYLAATEEERMDLKQKLTSSSLKEITGVLDGVIQIRGKELFNRTHASEVMS